MTEEQPTRRRMGPWHRATRRQYVILVALLAVLGMVAASLALVTITSADPSAGELGSAASGPAPAPPNSASRATRTGAVLIGPDSGPATGTTTVPTIAPITTGPTETTFGGLPAGPSAGVSAGSSTGDPAPDAGGADPETGSPQAYGWVYHFDYPYDDGGEQLGFGITRQEDGSAPGLKMFGHIWDRPAGIDVGFEIPEDAVAPLLLAPDQVSGEGMSILSTTDIPAMFTDRSGSSGPGPHPGTVAITLEGAGDMDELTGVNTSFQPYEGDWEMEFHAESAVRGRLAQATITVDCPSLAIAQTIIADWDSDFVQLFYGSPLDTTLTRDWGMLVWLE